MFKEILFEIYDELLKPVLAISIPVICLFSFAFLVSQRADEVGFSKVHRVYTDETVNYGVFRKGRFLAVRTNYLPATIEERNGKIVRADLIMKSGLVTRVYNPASSAEEALWHKHFQ